MCGAGKSTGWEDVPGTRCSCVQGDVSLFPLFPGVPLRIKPPLFVGLQTAIIQIAKDVFSPLFLPLYPAGSGAGTPSKEWCCGGGMKATGQGSSQAWPHPEQLNSSPRVIGKPNPHPAPLLGHPGWAPANAKLGKGWDKLSKEDRACASTFTPAQPQTWQLPGVPPGDPIPPPAKPEELWGLEQMPPILGRGSQLDQTQQSRALSPIPI